MALCQYSDTINLFEQRNKVGALALQALYIDEYLVVRSSTRPARIATLIRTLQPAAVLNALRPLILCRKAIVSYSCGFQ